MKVLCVGGGPGGLYAATQLATAGHEVTVVERNPPGVTYGWGVAGSELMEAIEASDPETARRIADNLATWNGQVIDHPDGSIFWPRGGGCCIGRHALIDVLAERAAELGATLEFEREVDWNELLHPTGDGDDWDLVVACDGINSGFREAHAAELGSASHRGRNYYVWLGTSRAFESFTLGFVRSEAGWLWAHAYRHAPDESTVTIECPPETWHGLGLDTMGLKESLALLEELFADQLQGHPLMVQPHDADAGVVPWRRHRAVRNERWHVGRVALLGDAAHTTHFSIGSGTRLALEDAQTLVRALTRHGGCPEAVPTALAEYESQRRAAVKLAQRDAQYSARWLEEIHRYTGLDAARFAALFNWRLSPFLAQLPPKPYHLLRRTIEENDALRGVWQRANSLRRNLYQARGAR